MYCMMITWLALCLSFMCWLKSALLLFLMEGMLGPCFVMLFVSFLVLQSTC